jgi:chromosome partitioning protein
VMQHAVRADRPVKAYQKWMKRIPSVYRNEVLDKDGERIPSAETDAHCLALLKHYRSLMPMAQEALKPMFHLKAADGALGGHIYAVQECYGDFAKLAKAIASKCDLIMPQ